MTQILIFPQYPEWLASKKGELKDEEYQKYEQQFKIVDKIVTAYESSPENVKEIMSLMEQMQETGQPPMEIMKMIAPGSKNLLLTK
jgi:peroxin-19